MSLAPYVRILGRGPGRSRAMTRDESRAAMDIILNGQADPHAIGALLMLMRFQGETPDEIAGFVEAMRSQIAPGWTSQNVALDWPTYAAGRSRGLPWFLLSAKLLASTGVRVWLHGWNSHQNPVASVRGALPLLDIPVVETADGLGPALDRAGIAYTPVEHLAPEAFGLLRLRDVLGLRSAVNTCLRVMNPGLADTTVQGVFHPPYLTLQSEASALLGQRSQTVIKGGGGEFERLPTKAIGAFGLRSGVSWAGRTPILLDESRRLAETSLNAPGDLLALWQGRVDDAFARAIVVGTAALALHGLGRAEDLAAADGLAETLWSERLAVVA